MPHPGGVVVAVVATPRAGATSLVDVNDGALRVRLAAPPVDGAANAALARCLADVFGVARSRVEVLSGQRGRRKRVLVREVSASEATASLARALTRA